jgi:hypothetical protein
MSTENTTEAPAPKPGSATVDAGPISDWIDTLAKARHAKKIATEREAEARDAILSYLDAHGARFGTINGVPRVDANPSSQTRFATAKFRDAYPDLAAEFSVSTPITKLELK